MTIEYSGDINVLNIYNCLIVAIYILGCIYKVNNGEKIPYLEEEEIDKIFTIKEDAKQPVCQITDVLVYILSKKQWIKASELFMDNIRQTFANTEMIVVCLFI